MINILINLKIDDGLDSILEYRAYTANSTVSM